MIVCIFFFSTIFKVCLRISFFGFVSSLYLCLFFYQLYLKPLSLDHYRQKHAKTLVSFLFFKSYDRLNQHMYEHLRFFRLHQNRITGADFVIKQLTRFAARLHGSLQNFSNNQIGEIHDNLNK